MRYKGHFVSIIQRREAVSANNTVYLSLSLSLDIWMKHHGQEESHSSSHCLESDQT